MNRRPRGRIAALLAAALALAAIPLPAHAGPVVGGPATGTLVITKLAERGSAGDAGKGQALSEVPSVGIGGVTFTLERVPDVDLHTEQGWAKAAAYAGGIEGLDAAADIRDVLTDGGRSTLEAFSTTAPFTTGPSGTVRIEGIPVGLYLVTEVSGPSNAHLGPPFLVTLPIAHPEHPATWEYTVHVYPKNHVDWLTKTVKDSATFSGGEEFTYDLVADVPEGAQSLTISDTLDERLTFGKVTHLLTQATDGGALAETDWQGTVTHSPDGAISVTFDAATLAAQARVGVRISVSANAHGVIDNVAHYAFTLANADVLEGASNEVLTKWATLRVTKVSSADGSLLEGATFDLYTGDTHARSAYRVASGTTGTDGVAEFLVRYDDFADNGPIDDLQYWIVETSPPQGHVLDATPVPVLAETFRDGVYALTVENAPTPPFALPTIGGSRAVLPVLALMVVAGGAAWLVRSRRAHG
ncbi:isopeptide-forming domain-containing fimbrial protein [Xylanimonas allomyrinae]|uniref:Isopeptide-forming domain-containing fimbrial protein n=1 Tax=Xylanimonas allomyrinae TaxID=2509459 RepID=A0A4P6EMW6_9MICO|nr:SpaH/EbpB family LPXTG-anchored major pilin [Xylanimonas allomyrinae]QAY62639.1 isopeptide-forming domain-containing fimbrial protein [Xylanimonas allomyrinae]